ncbi:MAG: alpha-ketoglutaric semialdehyde dehydrogenase [Verrucomicrobiales bacterium]
MGQGIDDGVREAGFPDGTFAMLQGASNEVGQALVEHPLVKAVAFTGSHAGGRAMFDLAVRREVPVPVYAEMGSVNPQFVFPNLLATASTELAADLFAAVTIGNGQFCTNPGLVFLCGESSEFISAYREKVRVHTGEALLNAGIKRGFDRGVEAWRKVPGLEILQEPRPAGAVQVGTAAIVARIGIDDFLQAAAIFQDEVFGPATVLIECSSSAQLLMAARTFGGQLGASIHGTETDLESADARELFSFISGIVGRVLINGFPTGLEVCDALQHGGPYPATTDAHWTSVGSAAIERFGRPLAYQDVPDALLPGALKEANPDGIRRLVDGEHLC